MKKAIQMSMQSYKQEEENHRQLGDLNLESDSELEKQRTKEKRLRKDKTNEKVAEDENTTYPKNDLN